VLEGMLIAIVIAAVAQMPWLIWVWIRERPTGGGGGSAPSSRPPEPPLNSEFDWEGFEDGFRVFAGSGSHLGGSDPGAQPSTSRTDGEDPAGAMA
jgi:hypothetical protein